MEFFQFAPKGINIRCGEFGAIRKRWRATAVRDAGAFASDPRTSRSVLECASPLALFLREPAYDVQYVECPATFFGFDLAERFDTTELRAHFCGRGNHHPLAP